MPTRDVLIVGAGPTGLVLALWLTRLGVKPRLIDKTAEPGTTSRALAVHARTLELYRQLDLTQVVLERGHKVPAVRLWVKGEPRARIDFEEADILGVFPLAGKGRARLIGTIRDRPASTESVPLGNERSLSAERAQTLKFQDVSRRIIDNLKVEVEAVNWFATYHTHHRVTEHFRKGRAFLLGDAAHIHSPAGGQGMNTGIGDAINLAWKLHAVIAGRAPDALLDSYELERIAFARRLVKTTDRVFTLATAEGRLAGIIRTRIVPTVLPALARFGVFREFLFRTVSQITINYRHCPLNAGQAGRVHGGDRLPWVAVDDSDNYEPLRAMTWQVHAYGSASADVVTWCKEHGLLLHIFAWRPEYEKAGFAQSAVYLIRPDTYIGLAHGSGAPDVLERYLDERNITI